MSEIVTVNEKNIRPTRPSSSETGLRGERMAADFLVREGYRLVMANFTVPIGRDIRGVQVKGEIDLIALEGETVCFVEVKTRASEEFVAASAAVDLRKQRLITRTARVYRRVFNITNTRHRYDVVTVIDDGRSDPRIELFRGFWTEAKFRKRVWSDDRF